MYSHSGNNLQFPPVTQLTKDIFDKTKTKQAGLQLSLAIRYTNRLQLQIDNSI